MASLPALPPDSWDCHAHVFGPYERYPLSEARSYTPPEAPLDRYLEMLSAEGIARGVLVHPSAYGLDWRILLDALHQADGRLRGVAVATADVADADLQRMNRVGVRALRFTEGTSASQQRFAGAVGLDALASLAPRLAALRWHAVIWAPLTRIADALPMMLRWNVPLVLDHMGSLDVTQGITAAPFRALLEALTSGLVWVKLCVPRSSHDFPRYADVRPFHDALTAARPDRLLWGTDWPFLRLAERTPSVARLLELLHEWVPDAQVRQQILVTGPSMLYW